MQDNKKINLITNSLMLTFVQCITLVTSMAQTKILSLKLSMLAYGTYSQGILIANTVMPFLLLGMGNAVNYFFNQDQSEVNKKKYVDTIFSIVFYTNLISGILILFLKDWICRFFGNDLLGPIILLIAFRPLMENIISLYQPLFISANMAKMIAIRNLIIGVVKVLAVGIVTEVSTDITVIFLILLLLDVLQLLFLRGIYEHRNQKVSYLRISKKIVLPVLQYAFPLGLSVMVGTLSLNMDKYIVGKMLTTEEFALYSNMAKELPFSFGISSLTTIIIPILIRLKATGRMEELKSLWKQYIEFGIIITWILVAGALVCGKELIIFLYSEEYVGGILIFNIYLIVSMTRITYFGMVQTLFGETKKIFYYSCMSLLLNCVLNYIFIIRFGIIGPAIATLLSIVLVNGLQLRKGLQLLELQFADVFYIKKLFLLISKLLLTCAAAILVKQKCEGLGNTVNLMVTYISFIFLMYLMERKNIKELFRNLNGFRL